MQSVYSLGFADVDEVGPIKKINKQIIDIIIISHYLLSVNLP
jgi:hypothetical protein